MNPTFTTVLLFVILTASSLVTSAKDRWVRDQGTSVEVVVVQKTPSTPAPVIVIATNATTTIPVTVTTATNVVVYQQTNWPTKVSTTVGFEKPTEHKATKVAKVQEPRRKKGFFGRFFGPSQPMMTDPISQSSLPANPVRWSESSLTLPTEYGTINYGHSQGTRVYAERSWDYNGPREVVDLSTYNETYFNFTPERRRWVAPTYYDNSGVQARTVTWP